MAVALGALLFVGPARADETYPNGPIRIICPIGAGNGPDLALRVVAEQLGKRWHQQVLVINQPGAGSLIAARNAAVERPDGSTFFMAVASTFVALPVMHSNLPLDVNDFVPVGFIGEVPMVLAVSPSLPVHSVDEFIRFAREHPGRVAVATTLPGDITDLSLKSFRQISGTDFAVVHYPKMALAMSDVASGRVAAAWEGIGGPSARGQLRLVGVASSTRLRTRPDLPTISETVPNFTATGWWVLVAPRGTPSAIVNRVNQALQDVLAKPEVQSKFRQLGSRTRTMNPRELSEFIRNEQQRWRPIIDKLGLSSRQSKR